MKSVMPITTFVTAMPAGGFKGLTRGQAILVDSQGDVVADAAAFVSSAEAFRSMKFVVGLGNGKYKDGVWINPRTTRVYNMPYVAPAAVGVTIDFTNVTDAVISQSLFASLNISIPPKMSVGIAIPRIASVWVDPVTDTAETVVARLNAEVQRVVAMINDEYGSEILTATPAATSIAITANVPNTSAFPLTLNVTADGAVSYAVITPTATNAPIGIGMGWQIAQEERKYAIENWGYDPNYKRFFTIFDEEVFLASPSANYNQLVIQTEGFKNHPFYPDTDMIFTQVIACTAAATLTTIAALFPESFGRADEPIVEPVVQAANLKAPIPTFVSPENVENDESVSLEEASAEPVVIKATTTKKS